MAGTSFSTFLSICQACQCYVDVLGYPLEFLLLVGPRSAALGIPDKTKALQDNSIYDDTLLSKTQEWINPFKRFAFYAICMESSCTLEVYVEGY